MTDPLIVLMLIVGPLCVIAWACDAYTKRRRPNKHTDALPPPAARCVVGNWGRDHKPVETR